MPLKVRNKELAQAVGLNPSRITQLKNEGVITPDNLGFYDLEEDSRKIGRPVSLEDVQEEINDSADEIIDIQKWRAVKMKEDALKSQRERQVFEKDLLDRDEVVKHVGEALHVVKTKLLTIPTSISGMVAVEEDAAICREIIEGNIREILSELSSQVAFEAGASPVPEAAAQTPH